MFLDKLTVIAIKYNKELPHIVYLILANCRFAVYPKFIDAVQTADAQYAVCKLW
jgi:hypothetical protein